MSAHRLTAFNKALPPHILRCQRRFRYHVQTLKNPRGRIVRLPCVLCPVAEAVNKPSEGHHIDYERPFVVVWLCESCHRSVEHGTKQVTPSMVHDYTSLVRTKPKGWHAHRPRAWADDVPF